MTLKQPALIFHNPGEIDIRGATIAGLSAKESDSAIGYFGTGLKYAIAQVLANAGSITIWSGLSKHTFHAKPLEFRGQGFSQIVMETMITGCMGDVLDSPITENLGFTTGYGKRWKAWQIFRELYANAKDELGDVAYQCTDTMIASPCEGTTLIIVEGWEELRDCYFTRDQIILPTEQEYDAECATLRVANTDSAYIYYKGVRVASRNCGLLWNFKSGLTLTEDRTVEAGSYEVSQNICQFVIWCEDEAIIRKVITAGKLTFEEAAMAWFSPPKRKDRCSPAFARVAADLYRQDPVANREYEELAMDYEPALRNMHKVELTPLQTNMLNKAKRLVSKMGYAYEIEHLPISVENLGGKVLGRYRDGTIQLSPLVFDQGTKQVVSTLYEECLHAKLGYSDCTYEMQTHLFNVIVGLFEEAWGEPC